MMLSVNVRQNGPETNLPVSRAQRTFGLPSWHQKAAWNGHRRLVKATEQAHNCHRYGRNTQAAFEIGELAVSKCEYHQRRLRHLASRSLIGQAIRSAPRLHFCRFAGSGYRVSNVVERLRDSGIFRDNYRNLLSPEIWTMLLLIVGHGGAGKQRLHPETGDVLQWVSGGYVNGIRRFEVLSRHAPAPVARFIYLPA
jgi:hypothetical protein